MLSFADHDPSQDAVFERHPVDDLEPLPASPFLQMADALSEVLVWLAETRPIRLSNLRGQKGVRHYFSPSKANLRTLAFLYALRPDLVDNSLRNAARRVGCSHEALRKHVDDFRRRFGFRTPGQWNEEARARLSQIVTEIHRQRKRGT